VFEEALHEIYPRAAKRAVRETDLDEDIFPATFAAFADTGWGPEQVLDMAGYQRLIAHYEEKWPISPIG
jgi:hypothetical protein